MANRERINVIVDGQNLDGRYFASMSKHDAVKSFKDNGISSDKAWAEKAWRACQEKVTSIDGIKTVVVDVTSDLDKL